MCCLTRSDCFLHKASHLPTLRDDNILSRLAFGICYCPGVFDLGDHIHALDDVTKNDVLAV